MADREAVISITRPAYTSAQYQAAFNLEDEPQLPLSTRAKNYLQSKAHCSGSCMLRVLLSFFPIVQVFRQYQWKKWILRDLIAGLSVGVIHIPQGMGFSLLTELPPVYGLYASVFPVWFYCIFGTSRHISVGTMALISLMIGAVVNSQVGALSSPVSSLTNSTDGNDTQALEAQELERFKVDIAVSVSLLAGLSQVAMYLCKLGVVVTYMSMSFVSSFMAGAAIHIITSQVPVLLGVPLERFSGLYAVGKTYIELFKRIDEVNVGSIVTSVICMAILILFKEFINVRFRKKLKVPIPIELFVVIAATLISHFCKLDERYDVAVIGSIPTGLPTPRVPSLHNFTDYIVDSIVVGIVGFAISITMAKMMSRKHKYPLDVQQEILAYGMQNALGSFFHSFAGTQAPPRTLVHESTGGKTQLANLISTLLPLLVFLALGPLFQSLPKCVLAAIIITALLPLLKEFGQLPRYWRVNKNDFVVWVVTLVTVVAFSISIGLAVGLACNIFLVVVQSQFVKGKVLSSPQNLDLYVSDKTRKKVTYAGEPTDVMVYTFDSNLYFSNAENFKTQIWAATMTDRRNSKKDKSTHKEEKKPVELNPSDMKENAANGKEDLKCKDEMPASEKVEQMLTTVVLDCSSIGYIDMMGLNTLQELAMDFKNTDIKFVLAACKPSLLEKLKLAGILDEKKEQNVLETYPSVIDAVMANTKTPAMIAIL